MNVIKLDKYILLDELQLPYDTIENKIIGKGRWSILREIVFKYQDKYWSTHYSTGATEEQYESPWEHVDQVECIEVHEVEVKVKKWVPVE